MESLLPQQTHGAKVEPAVDALAVDALAVDVLAVDALAVPSADAPGTSATEADAVRHLLQMLASDGKASIPGPQCCSSLYGAHPMFSQIVKAGGGLRKLCERHSDVLRFEADDRGGAVKSVVKVDYCLTAIGPVTSQYWPQAIVESLLP